MRFVFIVIYVTLTCKAAPTHMQHRFGEHQRVEYLDMSSPERTWLH